MHLQQVVFTIATFVFVLMAAGIIALPIRSMETIKVDSAKTRIDDNVNMDMEERRLDLTKRRRRSSKDREHFKDKGHSKDKEHFKGKGHDDDLNKGNHNGWLSSDSGGSIMPSENDESTSMLETSDNDDDDSFADHVRTKLNRNPVDERELHNIIAASHGKVAGFNDQSDTLTERFLVDADGPEILHGPALSRL